MIVARFFVPVGGGGQRGLLSRCRAVGDACSSSSLALDSGVGRSVVAVVEVGEAQDDGVVLREAGAV